MGSSLAYDKYFGNVKRPEIFELTDFKVPDITINLSEDDYNRYFLTYQCEYDMNIRHAVRNEDCYNAPWVDFTNTLDKAFKYGLMDKTKFDNDDLQIVKNGNITLTHFESFVTKYTDFTLERILSLSYGLITIPSYETEDASLSFDLDGKVTEVPIKFSVGGRSTTRYEKLGFNIKVKNETLFGIKQLRLRTEVVDPSFIREKLIYDMANALGLPCLSTNFARVFFNDRFMGFYAMRDAYKSHWIETTFGEKKTKHLYECDGNYGSSHAFNCLNDDEELQQNDVDFQNFLNRIDNTSTKEELAKFFDVEDYLKWQAIKFLIGGWDHGSSAQNLYLYMFSNPVTGMEYWIPLLYDFDNDLGCYGETDSEHSFEEAVYSLEKKNPIYKILGINENASPEVIKYMDEIMRNYFNPEALFSRIDQIKEFVDPYMQEDRIPDANGNRPGRVPRNYIRMKDYFTYEDFQINTEFTSIIVRQYLSDDVIEDQKAYGIKLWIIEKFKKACSSFNLDCSYADEFLDGFTYTPDLVIHEEHNSGCKNSDYECCVFPHPAVKMKDEVGEWGIENNHWCLIVSNEETEAISSVIDTCWSLSEGYPCCKQEDTAITYTSKTREAQYGVENGDWCGITDLQLDYIKRKNAETTNPAEGPAAVTNSTTVDSECWSLAENIPCCVNERTSVAYVSKDGSKKYGVENKDWCGITELQENYIESLRIALNQPEDCWSLQEGYPCCVKETTPVKYITEGRKVKFGVENGDWCGITDLQLNYIAAHENVEALPPEVPFSPDSSIPSNVQNTQELSFPSEEVIVIPDVFITSEVSPVLPDVSMIPEEVPLLPEIPFIQEVPVVSDAPFIPEEVPIIPNVPITPDGPFTPEGPVVPDAPFPEEVPYIPNALINPY